ncbi:efflux transporter outer membrane subunit [uncultured Devosia sp.]|uniref:efflux transporter outer membrane subunit n=1 Tax=uncultured Devosia sp. TaxID=211434 RepID=UPI0035CBFB33
MTTAIILASTLAGCTTLGPAYQPPTISSAVTYGSNVRGAKTITAKVQWWRAFNDATLDRLVDTGLDQNLTVAQALERVVAARESAVSTGLNNVPSGAALAQGLASGATSGDTDFSASASVSPGWEIDLFGGLAKQREAAQATLDAAIEEANGARLSLIGEIAQNYLQARGYQDRLYIARSTLESQNRTLSVTRQRNEAGLTSNLDLAQLQGEVSTTAATIPTLEIALGEAIHRLGVLLGQEPKSLRALFSDDSQVPRFKTSVSPGVPADLMRDRPDIRQAERQLAAATADIGVAEADLYPSLSLSGNLTVASTTTWSIGPALSLPVFNRGQLKQTVLIEQSQARQSYLGYKQTVLEAVEEVENALVGLNRQQTRRNQLANSYASYSQATELSEERYAAGETTLITLLTAQRSLYSARDSLAQSTVEVGLQYIALSLALGGGWDPSLR